MGRPPYGVGGDTGEQQRAGQRMGESVKAGTLLVLGMAVFCLMTSIQGSGECDLRKERSNIANDGAGSGGPERVMIRNLW